MAKRERKPLANTLKKDMKDRISKKEELADKVIEKLEGRGEVKPKPKKVPLSFLTVQIPQGHHDKLKLKAVESKRKIKEMIIEYIDSL